MTQTAGNFQARLRLTSAEGFGQRSLEDANCELLADSVALVIALSASGSAPARFQRSRDTQGQGQGQGLAFALSAHAAAVVGPLPGPALGAGATLAVEGLSALRLELSGTYYARQSTTYPQTDIGGRFGLVRVGARVCRLWHSGVFELAPCVGAQLYRIEGVGFGGVVWDSGAAFMWGPALGVFCRLRLSSHLSIDLAADGVVPVARRRFVYRDFGLLHRPAALAFQLFVAPEVRF